jgi:hypothetical protein
VWAVENVAMPASAREGAEGLVHKVTYLEGELVDAHQAREVVEEKFRSLSDVSTDSAR